MVSTTWFRSTRNAVRLAYTSAGTMAVWLFGLAGFSTARAQQPATGSNALFLGASSPAQPSSSSSLGTTVLDAPAEMAPALTKLVPPTKKKPKVSVRGTDVSLGGFGVATWSANPQYPSTVTSRETGASAGVLTDFHQQFFPFLGYQVDFGYTHVRERYTGPGSVEIPVGTYLPATGHIDTNLYELGVSYMIQSRPIKHRVSPFFQAGPSMLTFQPTREPFQTQIRPAFDFGAGVSYKVTPQLSVKLEYKGLFYRDPDFKAEGFGKSYALTDEPTLSLTYRFRPAKP